MYKKMSIIPGERLQLVQSSHHPAVRDFVVSLEHVMSRSQERHTRESARQSPRDDLHRQLAVILGLHHRQIRL